MHCFLINLKKDTQRLAAADAQLRALKVPYERVDGIDGKRLTPTQKADVVNYFRWWCALGLPVHDGEIGCALSHQAIYRRMLREQLPLVCILEDDVVLEASFISQLQLLEIMAQPDRAQVFLLSNHDGSTAPDGTVRRIRTEMYAEGYVLTLAAAKVLLRLNFPIITPCDHWGRWVKLNQLALYHTFPVACSQKQDTYTSNISERYQTLPYQKSVLGFLGHKVARLIGYTLDELLQYFTHR